MELTDNNFSSAPQENHTRKPTETPSTNPERSPTIPKKQVPSQSTPQNPKSQNDNIVFVGNKHLMNYVNSVSMQLKSSPEVIIKARGKFISKAVDIVEVAKRQAQDGPVNIKDIKTGTEEYENEGKKVKVSTIDLFVTR